MEKPAQGYVSSLRDVKRFHREGSGLINVKRFQGVCSSLWDVKRFQGQGLCLMDVKTLQREGPSLRGVGRGLRQRAPVLKLHSNYWFGPIGVSLSSRFIT